MAPTAMKTVPSGRVEWFMKGAFAVGGTVGGGKLGISVFSVLLREGRPGRGGGAGPVVVVCDVGTPRGGSDTVVLAVVCVFVFVELAGGGGAGACDVGRVLVLVVGGAGAVFVVAGFAAVVVCWAKTPPERREMVKAAERSERFRERRANPMVAAAVTVTVEYGRECARRAARGRAIEAGGGYWSLLQSCLVRGMWGRSANRQAARRSPRIWSQ